MQPLSRLHSEAADLHGALCHFSPKKVCIVCDRIVVSTGEMELLKYRVHNIQACLWWVLLQVGRIKVIFPPRKPYSSTFTSQDEHSQCLLTMVQIFGSQ